MIPSFIRGFRAATNASIIIPFALILPVMLFCIGSAIDLSRANSKKVSDQARLDSAIVAGLAAARTSLNSGLPSATAIESAKSAATAYLSANSLSSTNVSFTVTNGKISASGSLKGSVQTLFLPLFGYPTLDVSVVSEATFSVASFMNIYLLVDVSASMLLPSSKNGIDQMQAATGCALACHDSSKNKDSYNYALNNNIELRHQVLNKGVTDLLNYLNSNSLDKTKVQVGLWSFDHELKEQAALTTDYLTVASKYPAPSLAYNDEAAATPFDTLIPNFVSIVGKSGDGTTAASPQKLVILATDGVNDPTRAWKSNTQLREQVRPFNTSFCSTMQANGVIVAIIYTPYFPMTWDRGYNATLGRPGRFGGKTRVDDIPIVLKACAGSNYIAATDSAAIQAAFTALFQKSQPIHLTK